MEVAIEDLDIDVNCEKAEDNDVDAVLEHGDDERRHDEQLPALHLPQKGRFTTRPSKLLQ